MSITVQVNFYPYGFSVCDDEKKLDALSSIHTGDEAAAKAFSALGLYEHVADVAVPYVPGWSVNNYLYTAFELMQNAGASWDTKSNQGVIRRRDPPSFNGKSLMAWRSSGVGDIYLFEGKRYIVSNAGFKLMSPDNQ